MQLGVCYYPEQWPRSMWADDAKRMAELGITHVRIVPMMWEEVHAAMWEIELPPADQRLFAMLDYTDEAFWWGTVESPDDVKAVETATAHIDRFLSGFK